MNEQHKYRATDKMSDLICDNYSLLMVMSRFGLSLGFGDKSVKDVCEAQHVDYRTFLAVANFISEEQYSYSADNDSFSIPALMDYLKRAHAYFLDFNLPAMRRKLIEAIDCSRDNDVAYLILKSLTNTPKSTPPHGIRKQSRLHLRGATAARQTVRCVQHRHFRQQAQPDRHQAEGTEKHHHQVLSGKREQQSSERRPFRHLQLRTGPCIALPGRRLYVCSRRSANRKKAER